jgi:hypothetical protein
MHNIVPFLLYPILFLYIDLFFFFIVQQPFLYTILVAIPFFSLRDKSLYESIFYLLFFFVEQWFFFGTYYPVLLYLIPFFYLHQQSKRNIYQGRLLFILYTISLLSLQIIVIQRSLLSYNYQFNYLIVQLFGNLMLIGIGLLWVKPSIHSLSKK